MMAFRITLPQRYLGALALLLSWNVHGQERIAIDTNSVPGVYRTIYSTDWRHGIDPAMPVQEARSDDVTVVDDPVAPERNALRVHVARDEDFVHVANGSPRAEILLPRAIGFASGHDYLIRWSTFLPTDFSFDLDQMQIITQIHQSAETGGPPPFMLTLLGTSYTVSERGGIYTRHGHGLRFGCADCDIGRWIHWALHYVPDASGKIAQTQLWKDGEKVFESRGLANSYPGETHAYLKIGIYKPGWVLLPSTISETQVLYGALTVAERDQR